MTEIEAAYSSRLKESIANHKQEISTSIEKMGKLNVEVLDPKTKKQLYCFGDLFHTYDEMINLLMIDFFLKEQVVKSEIEKKPSNHEQIVKQSFKELFDKVKMIEKIFDGLKHDFSMFWQKTSIHMQ